MVGKRACAAGAGVPGPAGALDAHDACYVAPGIFAPLLTSNIALALVVS